MSDELLAWVRRSLLACYRARDYATMRAGLRQVILAICTTPKKGKEQRK